MGPNNANADRSNEENAIAINFVVKNKKIKESNENAKVSFEI